jgi:hypothetical protein
LLRFHAALARDPPAGFVTSHSCRIDHAPWDAQSKGLFEDWYLLRNYAALGDLNEAAVDPLRRPKHDEIAALSHDGRGGLYRLIVGSVGGAPGSCVWFAKPPNVTYGDLLAAMKTWVVENDGTLWQRQMVLGPAPEFCALFLGGSPSIGPEGSEAISVRPLDIR